MLDARPSKIALNVMSDFWRNLMLTVIAACAVVWTGFLLYAVKTGVDTVDAVVAVLAAPAYDEEGQHILDDIIELFEEPGEDGGGSE